MSLCFCVWVSTDSVVRGRTLQSCLHEQLYKSPEGVQPRLSAPGDNMGDRMGERSSPSNSAWNQHQEGAVDTYMDILI